MRTISCTKRTAFFESAEIIPALTFRTKTPQRPINQVKLMTYVPLIQILEGQSGNPLAEIRANPCHDTHIPLPEIHRSPCIRDYPKDGVCPVNS